MADRTERWPCKASKALLPLRAFDRLDKSAGSRCPLDNGTSAFGRPEENKAV